MLRSLTIRNFKSIVDLTLDLGRFNVFIGENGCGKTNVLEALGLAAGAAAARLTNEDLVARGLRVAKPSLMVNAFAEGAAGERVELVLGCGEGEFAPEFLYRLDPKGEMWGRKTAVDSAIQDLAVIVERHPGVLPILKEALKNGGNLTEALQKHIEEAGGSDWSKKYSRCHERMAARLKDFAIFCADTLALRGLEVQSRREPLGLFGEALDVAIATMPPPARVELVEQAKLVSWLDDIAVDEEGTRKLGGYKLGRSLSNLYFEDRFLADESRIFSAENANEGILHVLFHLVLFMHPDTPKLLAVDNIESCLNPHLLRRLVTTLAALAKEHDRQALVTTHNPATLDGLNLHDDDQRLFVVYRNDDGHTEARRIQMKPNAEVDGMKLKLSELWMRGMLGGIPTHF